MQWCKKRKPFSKFFLEFLKFTSNVENFEKKDEPDSLCISEIKDCERGGETRSKKPRFKTPFDSHYAKVFQTLLKSAAQHFYHIFLSLWGKLSLEVSLILISEILGMFGNTLIATLPLPRILFLIGRTYGKSLKREYLRK